MSRLALLEKLHPGTHALTLDHMFNYHMLMERARLERQRRELRSSSGGGMREAAKVLLLTTYYLLLTTYYLLLTTYYVLLTTYYLLLTTYYVMLKLSCNYVNAMLKLP